MPATRPSRIASLFILAFALTPLLYAFLLRRTSDGTATYEPHLIDDTSGVGTEIAAADVNGDGRADIITANKRGAFVFLSASSK